MTESGLPSLSPELNSSVSAVLQQMRALQTQAAGELTPAALARLDRGPAKVGETQTPVAFGELLRDAVDGVNELQQEAASLSAGFVKGEHRDLVSASIASQKSSLAFQAVVTARNRMVSAYQDIMNMPI
ncbi:MAG: flagellar hook-basal body complex protein FliE [Pseudomonadota bacterium]